MTTAPFHVLLIGRFLALRRIAVYVSGIVLRRDVTKVSHDIHHLVVAQQADHSSPCLWRFLFQGDQKIHYVAWLRTPIQEVPDLNQGSPTAGPVMLRVDEPSPLENDDKIIKVAMNVADGDYGLPLIRRGFGRSRPCQANQHQEQEGGNTRTVVVRNRERRAEHLPASCSRGLRILQESH